MPKYALTYIGPGKKNAVWGVEMSSQEAGNRERVVSTKALGTAGKNEPKIITLFKV